MFTRQGASPGLSFPLQVGIECFGTVAGYPPGAKESIPIGSRVASCMGGLGRQIPGSYAEYTCVTSKYLRRVPETKNLSIAELASLPEMMETTWGSLKTGLDLQKGESLLIRGSTSSIGLCALQLARTMGASRIGATTRSAKRETMLKEAGADEVYVDNGKIADQVAASAKGGYDKVLELTGTTTLLDSLHCAVVRGTVCMTGIQGGSWQLEKFQPLDDIPNRVRLASYGGDAQDWLDLPFDEIVKNVDEGRIKVPVKAFKFDEIHKVHEILESGGGGAKMVIVVAEE
jgi:NADPH:quinone reductase-like Zn-dependent oxidoreductase